jgi:hypothetical protein
MPRTDCPIGITILLPTGDWRWVTSLSDHNIAHSIYPTNALDPVDWIPALKMAATMSRDLGVCLPLRLRYIKSINDVLGDPPCT